MIDGTCPPEGGPEGIMEKELYRNIDNEAKGHVAA